MPRYLKGSSHFCWTDWTRQEIQGVTCSFKYCATYWLMRSNWWGRQESWRFKVVSVKAFLLVLQARCLCLHVEEIIDESRFVIYFLLRTSSRSLLRSATVALKLLKLASVVTVINQRWVNAHAIPIVYRSTQNGDTFSSLDFEKCPCTRQFAWKLCITYLFGDIYQRQQWWRWFYCSRHADTTLHMCIGLS